MFRHPADPDSRVIFPEQWHGRPAGTKPYGEGRPAVPSTEHPTDSDTTNKSERITTFIGEDTSQLPAIRSPKAEPQPPRPPLVPERSDFFEGDAPAADKVQAFLTRALEAAGGSEDTAAALVPWICDTLLSNHSVKAYGRDFMDFVRHMQAQGVTPLEVTADHVKLYKRALLEAGMASATVARRLSVLRGAYEQLAAKGLIPWEIAQGIAAVKAPGVQKNATPSLTQRQAVALLEAIPTDT